MSVLVREEWYVFYKKCEDNLEKIRKILENKDFMNFYDESDKEKSDHWHEFLIPIYDLTRIGDPENRKLLEAMVEIKKNSKGNIHID